ncbi:protein of unknown function DUF309 [Desulfobulbus propionicus DSM 2032]|jgi:hypothetical protein|uniref:DUF309 domain-containing protein n=1 Tax=Desulfobulbus propionicus (strain ATCC 33891 / DSM 2032 / VKM B-1956 / 1pr3) TaxID=577650 RepID=A0A7U3YPU6_DESPD|nr:DUF309 domain-containing protein [Desulfobulbus propionicus]ADW19355.1 protein of unknown function DUF309 [Desulfobulbus propionicus DSM 2032]
MIHHPFDPFRDRLSRDIRNQLSAALPACLREQRLAPAQGVADRFLAARPGPEQVAYIHDRLERYARFLDGIASGPEDVLWQGLVLWDLGLHFEVHEILEQAWHRAQGTEKAFLQAMIRAAGVYIKREYGFVDATAQLAAKALPVLDANRDRLAAYTDPQRLLEAMRHPWEDAPRLLA